jgi:hypothetical protein
MLAQNARSCFSTANKSITRKDYYSDAPDWYQEFRLSAIPDRLTLANVGWIDGQDAIQMLTEEAIAQCQKITSYVTETAKKILKRYEFAAAGGWVAQGVTLTGERGTVPYFKPDRPRQTTESKGFGQVAKIKTVKYETPQGMEAVPLLPCVDPETAQVIYDRYHAKPQAGESFWQVVKRCNIPIAITEGLKKAFALIAHGIPAIGIRGITQWRTKGTHELHPTIADFATPGRKVTIFFDQDEKIETQKNVRIQILKLGEALANGKCKASVALWNVETGKGVDDCLYALGAGAQTWLDSVLDDAPDLELYKRDSRILQNLEAIRKLNTLTYPVERATSGGYLPELPEIEKGSIAVLSASQNGGKTTRIGRDYVKTWIDRGGLVLVLTPINNLGKQAANDWNLPHIHNYATDPDSQNALWAEVNHAGGIVLCGESLHRIPTWVWSKPVLLILDEANQITESLTQGDTLGSRYSDILERLTSASRHAIETGAIVLSEDGIPDRAVKFMQDISGCETVKVVTHRKADQWDVTLYRGKASGYRAKFLEAAGTQKLLYVTSSQREAQRIERALSRRYPDLKIVRIDSKTNQGGQFTGFFEQPDLWLQENQPDILILSPSAKSGVSIEGGVRVEDAYFKSVWGYFPALGTDTHSQLLGRYRPAVPRVAFCPDVIMTTGDESLLSSRAIRQRLKLNATAIAGAYGIADLLSDDDGNELRGTIETAIMNYLCDAKKVAGYQKRIAHHALASRLKKAGHNVSSIAITSDPDATELWEIINEELWREEAAAIAGAVIEDTHTLKWARKALDGLDTSLETRLLAQKCIWRSDFPGMMFDCEKECYSALTRDYGAMARGVKLQAKAENIEGAMLDDAQLTKEILSGNIRALHRIPRSHLQARLIAMSGVLSLTDGVPYTNEDPRCKAVKQWALNTSKEISYWLGLHVNADQTAIEICHKLLKRMGLERDKSDQLDKHDMPGRIGAIKMVGRKGKRGANTEQFQIDLNYDPIRAKLLEAARRKLSESVTSISNKENLSTEINVPPRNSDGGAVGGFSDFSNCEDDGNSIDDLEKFSFMVEY